MSFFEGLPVSGKAERSPWRTHPRPPAAGDDCCCLSSRSCLLFLALFCFSKRRRAFRWARTLNSSGTGGGASKGSRRDPGSRRSCRRSGAIEDVILWTTNDGPTDGGGLLLLARALGVNVSRTTSGRRANLSTAAWRAPGALRTACLDFFVTCSAWLSSSPPVIYKHLIVVIRLEKFQQGL